MSSKNDLLRYYRENIAEVIESALKLKKSSDRSSKVNKKMLELLNSKLKVDNADSLTLDYVLMAHYTYYIVMLESRNKVWNYDYMSFSRRIGELWEPFCKLAFEYSTNKITFYTPMTYEEYKSKLSIEVNNFIDNLSISQNETIKLKTYLSSIWELSESGAINLKEDLHFTKDCKNYVVDFKSGFSSNEKGNVNRLLQVAKIYSTIDYNCMIFVRQKEEDNNHYLQTLKNSPHWEVYCADDTYSKIFDITGVDLKSWMKENMCWLDDITSEFKNFLESSNLVQYLTW